jgi:hypothetical protein
MDKSCGVATAIGRTFPEMAGQKVKIDFLFEHFRYIPFAIELGF